MKTLLWIIIITALIFGGWHLYKKYSSESAEQTQEAAAPAAPAPAQSTAQEPEQSTAQAPAPATNKTNKETPNSGKGLKNWRPVKKVLDLSNQHNKDLENNM